MTFNAQQSSHAWMEWPWDAAVLHFQEIALKGGNRPAFVKLLAENVRRRLKPIGARVTNLKDRLLVTPAAGSIVEVLERAAPIHGIAYVAPIRHLDRRVECLQDAAVELYRALAPPGASFAIRARRNDKSFPLTSREINQQVGAAVVAATGAPVDLLHPDLEIRFRVYADRVCLIGPRQEGPGGLPVGSAGKVLTLLSGGFDSPVAAWHIMRRGARTDFIHFHVFPEAEAARETKIPEQVRLLLEPQAARGTLLLVPYHAFQMQLMRTPVPPELELILFRRFMARVAADWASENRCEALVTGDNLGQVASQTLRNLAVMDEAVTLPILRPLLTANKTGIIAHANRLGLYETAIRPYKDCCSLIARHPDTRPRPERVREAEAALPLDRMMEQVRTDSRAWRFDGLEWAPELVRWERLVKT
jgi:thiamine biosynthesis protein ThiI